ncbi:MAG: polysaccharide pyruvyl transferase family protein [Chryseobacterium sp.]|nr:polysaccharide pyruvyl transferase family protein [Chryseobacterium sp.]
MKAIIVPAITDMNKGDQALVWESYRLVKDTGLYRSVFILNSGNTEEEREKLSGQTRRRGYPVLENILKHPRRGRHKNEEHIQESKLELAKQIKNAGLDFLSTRFLILIANSPFLVKIFYNKRVQKTVSEFRNSDTVFVKGGGFIHAYGERTAPYLMWYFLFYVRLAKRMDKKVVFLPNSYGPFKGLTVESQVKNVFNKLDLVYAREKVSADAMSKLLGKNIPVEMDLGFFLQKGSEEKAIELLNKYNLSPNNKIVGITVRPWRFPGKENPTELYEKYLNSVRDLIDYSVKKGYKVALCNQSIGPNSHEDDCNAIKDLLKKIDKNDNVVWINENLDCDDLKALYSFFSIFVGTRFHSVIFSLTSLVPSIAIGYGGNKAKGIMGDFNFDEFVVQIEDVTGKGLMKMFDEISDNYDLNKKKINDYLYKLDVSRNKIMSDIKGLYQQVHIPNNKITIK